MTYQQRVQILKDLPIGSQVIVFHNTRNPRKAIKISDMENCMMVQAVITDSRFPVSYDRITCDTIVKVEVVTQRLQGRNAISG